MIGTAKFSEDMQYRYLLDRTWDESKGRVLFIMLNPSTADAEKLDPTVARCMKYAHTWNYGSGEVVNLFALRSTDPKKLMRVEDPIGPDNDRYTKEAILRANLIIAAWGNIAKQTRFKYRGKRIEEMIVESGKDTHCLKITKIGEPVHPLYQPGNARPILYRCHQ